MRYTVATLLSAATFSLSTFARPSSSPPGSDTISTPLKERFISGSCGVHVVQYQKNEGPANGPHGNSNYRLDVTLYDAGQDNIGGVTLLDAPGGNFEGIDSQLPLVFEVEVGANDQQPVRFQYGAQAWDSNAAQCSVGDYDSGSRQMDCQFNC